MQYRFVAEDGKMVPYSRGTPGAAWAKLPAPAAAPTPTVTLAPSPRAQAAGATAKPGVKMPTQEEIEAVRAAAEAQKRMLEEARKKAVEEENKRKGHR